MALLVPDRWSRVVLPSFVAALGFGLMLALQFYPQLVKYQAPSMAAHVLEERGVPKKHVLTFGPTSYALDFMLRTNVPPLHDPKSLPAGESWIFTDEAGKLALSQESRTVTVIAVLPEYPVSHWNVNFFRPGSRERLLTRRYVLQVR